MPQQSHRRVRWHPRPPSIVPDREALQIAECFHFVLVGMINSAQCLVQGAPFANERKIKGLPLHSLYSEVFWTLSLPGLEYASAGSGLAVSLIEQGPVPSIRQARRKPFAPASGPTQRGSWALRG
jgi:hypothetical protein